jgi:hypothetical protein
MSFSVSQVFGAERFQLQGCVSERTLYAEIVVDLLARSIVKAGMRMDCLNLAEMESSAALTLIYHIYSQRERFIVSDSYSPLSLVFHFSSVWLSIVHRHIGFKLQPCSTSIIK